MKASKEKLFILRMIVNFYYCYQVYNNWRRYRRRPAMTDGQFTATNRRRLFGFYSWPAAGGIYTLIPRLTE